ncbi:hybrid sensor histidine kinase/response regulator [Chroococcidiopsis sp. FACHB-1243]|uniref:hybrid sensor histidine kinase/response regulator n=1 Tax=Chroococcidiopsis sp. [FACHB-1243] TaxID=2692781 RepID=UPI00177CF277|nr:hybrid sensor histidine kinase/response regulator [Chroococcidiopsis sp. [FACHB-1243]]MBD2308423.1 hybrid sensor histidine kinase/response regulator [Chroococcidiopsis sp. [FACHB-1243]]
MLITPDIRDQAYRLFIEEVPELLQEIEAGLLSLKQERTHERIHDLMRAAHSLKGGAACLDLEPIKIVAHRLEDVFRALYNRSVAIDSELEGLLLQAYDCLRVPLLQQITIGSIDCAATLAVAEPVFNQIEERLGDALAQIDRYMPMSSELGVDLVASIFETDVVQGLERLAAVVTNPQDFEVAGELRAQAEVFAGFAELLNLPGFGAIAQTALTALNTHPDRAREIIQVALADFHNSRAAVLAGDRTTGGSPSAALCALTEQSVDLVPHPESEFSPLLDELLFGDETAPIEAVAIDPDIIFVTETEDDSNGAIESDAHSLTISPAANISPIQSLSHSTEISQSNIEGDRSKVGSINSYADEPQIATAVSTRVELSRLERMHKLLGELVVNRNSIALQTEQTQNSSQELLRRFAHFQELIGQLERRAEGDKGAGSRDEQGAGEKRAEGEKLPITNYPLPTTNYQLPITTDFDPLEMDRYGAVHPLLQRILEEIVQLEEAVEDIALFAEQSSQILERKQQVFSQLQDELMRARMLPLGEVLKRFSRMLRDMSHTYSKPVNLKLRGTEVQVEKAILEKLYDPLLHLLRNAFAHGIESPEIRQQQGKPENGEILICAYYKGNQTIIEVRDDGRGLNLGQIRSRVVELGWLSPIEAASASKEQLLEFIFEPGFSTTHHVSELSGRGMGLDVVRSQLRSLRGSVSVSSFPGEGTTFILRLPLTLTIANLVVCSTGKTTVALPSDSIENIVTTPSDRINRTGTQQLLRWREHIIPIHRLADLLEYNRPMLEVANSQSPITTTVEERELPMLLLRWEGELLALEVDCLLAEQELAIKPFGSLVSPPKYTYGCTLLGNGSLVPVINGVSLLEHVLERQQNTIQTTESQSKDKEQNINNLWRDRAAIVHKTERPTILVVDDSTTMRQTLTLSLQKAGYRVLSARDGLEALEKLQQSPTVQLVLCDIEMPNMNGFEFLCQWRQEPQFAKIPVAMLTSRSNDKHRRLATQLGASAYFTKPYIELEFLQALKNIFEQNIEEQTTLQHIA